MSCSLGEGIIGCLQSGGGGGVGEEYLTIDEVAERLKISPKTVRNKMARGVWQEGEHYFRPAGLGPRFKWSALVAWLESPEQKAPRAPMGDGGIPMVRGYYLN